MTTIGYFEEFIVQGKFIGTLLCEKQDREIGYYGKKTMTTNEDIVLQNKKKIKKGTEFYTIYYTLNGKL